jgi:hypothetical protein
VAERKQDEEWWVTALRTERSFWNQTTLEESLFGGSPAKRERQRRFESAGLAQRNYEALCRLMLESVPQELKPLAKAPSRSEIEALRRSLRRQAVEGTRVWNWKRRLRARSGLRAQAEAAADALIRRRQAELDKHWDALSAHDSQAVLKALREGFGSAPFPTLGYARSREGALVILECRETLVPEGEPDLTPTDKLTVRRVSKSRRNTRYVLLLNAVAWSELRRPDGTADLSEIGAPCHIVSKGRTKNVESASFDDWPELGILMESFAAHARDASVRLTDVSALPGWSFAFLARPASRRRSP